MLHAALIIVGITMLVPPPKLAEIRVDSLPPLTNAEYIELIGVAGFSLDGLSIVVIGDDDSAIGPALGNSGVLEAVISLDGQVIPADRSFLIHASPALPIQADLDAITGLDDADNLTVLLVRQCKARAGDDLDLDDDGVLDIEPWSELIDGVSIIWGAPGVQSEWTYASARVGPNGGFFIFQTRRCLDTDAWHIGSFAYSTDVTVETAGAVNPPCAGSLCEGDINQDAAVDAGDLSLVLAHWGQLGTVADINGDGVVGAGDLSIVLAYWGACDL